MEMLKTLLVNQEKAEANRKIDKEDTNASTKRMLAEMTEKMDTNMGAMKAALKSAIREITFNREETVACQETMEASLEAEGLVSMDTTPEVAHEQEVSSEDAEVMAVRGPKTRRRDQRHLATGRRRARTPNIV
jgi:hypothetical protein